jgi:class 3 adenylate cyclase/tetratricopeptide (TPR) repeat protein
MTTAATVTLLFTDLVGSTELLSRVGADAADELRAAHDRFLRDAITAHGGTEVKHLGDGIMAAFTGAADSVACAVAIQQAAARHSRNPANEPLEIRIGLSAGDVTEESGDYFGEPVVEASRLCAAAAGGQILTSDIVRLLAGSRGGHTFSTLGSLELKGLPDPVAACEVVWGAPDTAPEVPLPAALATAGQFAFVGRDEHLERLGTAWKQATTESRRVILVAGEPGIGKTRLTAELARRVHDGGALALYGRCDEGLGVPYQPFVEALRHYVSHCARNELRDRLGPLGGELTRVLPELTASVPDLPTPLRADPETETYRLFEAVIALLAAATTERPVLLVLDDLHWAATPTLLLLRHLIRSTEPMPLLVVGTYRDTDLGRTHPLAEMLADLRRESGVERIALGGLDEAGVASFLERAAGHELDDNGQALARAVHAETEGNPFFVGEILLNLAETGTIYQRDGRWVSDLAVEQVGIPEGVREVIGRRLSRLSETDNAVLAVAAVVGRDFDLSVVTTAGELSEADVVAAIERAEAARLVTADPEAPDRYQFSHALVRGTLYDELNTSRRLRLHRKIGEAIEARYSDHLEPHLGELAQHFGEAAAASEVAKATDYALRAAQQALDQLAYSEAIDLARRALATLDASDAPDPRAHAELLLMLSDARSRAGDIDGGKDAASEAAVFARLLGDTELLAQAALLRSEAYVVFGLVDEVTIALLEEALTAVGTEDTALRAHLVANLCSANYFRHDVELEAALTTEALALAREVGDDDVLSRALLARMLAARPGREAEMLEAATEVVTVAARSGSLQASFGHQWRAHLLLSAGDIAGADRDLAATARLAQEQRMPVTLANSTIEQACRRMFDAPLSEAEELVEEALAKSQHPTILQAAGATLWVLRRDQARAAELEDTVRAFVADNPNVPAWRCVLESLLLDLGQLDAARAVYEDFARDDFSSLPRDAVWLAGMSGMVEVCAAVGDAPRAEVLSSLLRPFEDRAVVVGGMVLSYGSVARYLALLATTRRDYEEAERLFVKALAFDARCGNRRVVSDEQAAFAKMLLARDGPGDRERANELLDAAAATAHELELTRVERLVEELRGRSGV